MSVYQKLLDILEKPSSKKKYLIGLIDPDKKNKINLQNQIDYIKNDECFCAVLVGGSLIMDSGYNSRIELIKKSVNLPVIAFPSSSNQINKNFDAIFFLSLISGRNAQYLIGEQVISAPIIYDLKIESIPIGYILLDGGRRSSVEIVSNTTPLPMDNHDIVIAHSLAAEYLGHKFIYFECGSGAFNFIDLDLLAAVKKCISIPIIVGGGIKNKEDASLIRNAGADLIVVGSMIENKINNESAN